MHVPTLTAVWPCHGLCEREWIEEIFHGVLVQHVIDEKNSFTGDNCLVINRRLRRELASYERFRSCRNAFLMHLSDETYEGGYEVYSNFTGVFRNYWSSAFNTQSVMVLPLGPCGGIATGARVEAASRRPFIWCFAGDSSKASRPAMIAALSGLSPHFCRSTQLPGTASLGQDAYREMLSGAAFCPCPMGNVNLESFRVYEALELGAIPIVEKRASLDYFRGLLGPHPLISVGSWKTAARIMRELLADPARLDFKQREVLDWWENCKSRLQGDVREFIARRSAADARASRSISLAGTLPLWQWVELVRHHSPGALARRVGRHFTRLRRDGKLRSVSSP